MTRCLLLLASLLFCAAPARARVLTGIDVLEKEGFVSLKGKRVGLVANHTSRDGKGRHDAEVLAAAPGVRLAALFTPEHGFKGKLEDKDVASSSYTLPDGRVIPLHSLYGPTKAPTPEMLAGLDALLFDIQDVGARFYTYSATMGMALEAASRSGVELVVLDRPNPVGGELIEGAILDDSIARHITAYFPVPTRHGLTLGEVALLHAASLGPSAKLRVVAMEGWSRDRWYDSTGLKWIPPSPNMPDVDAAALYTGVGCLEASNLSVGRGTPIPFRWIGAPWLDAAALAKRMTAAGVPGVKFSTKSYRPSKSNFKGLRCRGLRIRITDRKALRTQVLFAHLLCALRDLHPKEFKVDWPGEARMSGTPLVQGLYESGARPEAFIALFEKGAAEFRLSRQPHLLY